MSTKTSIDRDIMRLARMANTLENTESIPRELYGHIHFTIRRTSHYMKQLKKTVDELNKIYDKGECIEK